MKNTRSYRENVCGTYSFTPRTRLVALKCPRSVASSRPRAMAGLFMEVPPSTMIRTFAGDPPSPGAPGASVINTTRSASGSVQRRSTTLPCCSMNERNIRTIPLSM